jgi:demethylmenaquinone methyltransferase / 2-methoxy-6-polyprenyl-1,4-benzoquinol methylase
VGREPPERSPRSGAPSAVPSRAFVRELFDWLAPRYEAALAGYTLGQDLRWKHELIRVLRPRPGETALDLACGTGLILDRLALRPGSGAVVGLDVNRTMLAEAVRRRPPRRLVAGTAERLPFRDGSFDLVTGGYLLKYVNLDRLASEVRRVLKPGGRFGAYDFSAPLPETARGRLYGPFLRRLLPRLARARRSENWSMLFRFLASVSSASDWESKVEGTFLGAGFASARRAASLGGAITWFWAST